MNTYLLPIPFLRYRGDRFRVDDGFHSIIFDNESLLLTLSGNLSLPTDEDTPERVGMDQLAATFEIGPSLNYRFYKLSQSAWWFDLPLRYAFTLDGRFDHIGWVFQPRLAWRMPATRLGDWALRFNLGPLFSSEQYHQYYYSVSSDDALPLRPAFQAEGGYSGIRTEFSYSRRFGKYRLGGYIRYDDLSGSVIEDSPLVSNTSAWLGGIVLTWVFHQK
jgi:outer membrane scaffolding protein for murein synthesis (MipA/OmpV family)